MAELNRDYQIIVVDDASSDTTPAVLSPYIRVMPLTVIRNSQRRGYADSMEVAIREAVRRAPYPKRDTVITLQADFTEDPDVVPAMVKKIEAGADIVATDVTVEDAMPRRYRWGRGLMRWLLRGKEWSLFGDPLSGMRAYRVITMKRAIESRGTGRLLSWNRWGANAELLSLTVPHSRRTDVVEATLKHQRHQRDTRFSFMDELREVRGAATGKPNARATALPTDGVIATPLPLAVEQAAARQHPKVGERSRGRGGPRVRERGRERDRDRDRERGRERAQERGPRSARRAKQPRAQAEAPEAAPPVMADAEVAPPQEGVKKKRRRRRRSKKNGQGAPQLVMGETETMEEAPVAEGETPADAQPKKKSRRGRRGGRGRRRGPRTTNGGTTDTPEQDGGGEAAPPMAAEGD